MTLSRQQIACVVAFVTLMGGAASFRLLANVIDAVLRKEPVPLRANLSTIPGVLGRWQQVGADEVLSAEIMEELGTDKYLTRTFAMDGDVRGPRLDLHVAFYTGMIDAVPHIPERCNLGSGLEKSLSGKILPIVLARQTWADPLWDQVPEQIRPAVPDQLTRTLMQETVRLPRLGTQSQLEMNISQYWHPKAPDHRFCTGYFFVANGRTTPSASGVKALAFRLSERKAYYCKVQISYFDPQRSVDEMELARVASDFLSEALPEIMRCLPDWNEVLMEQWAADHNGGAQPAPGNDSD